MLIADFDPHRIYQWGGSSMITVSTESARRFLEQKRRKRQAEWDRLFQKATRDCEAIVKMIIEKYRPRRVWQWGSLLHPELFRDYSDIDLAVEGIDDPAAFFAMLGDAERLTTFPLDILDFDRIEKAFSDIIRMKGKVIYEC